jgi:hypothetical protein
MILPKAKATKISTELTLSVRSCSGQTVGGFLFRHALQLRQEKQLSPLWMEFFGQQSLRCAIQPSESYQ